MGGRVGSREEDLAVTDPQQANPFSSEPPKDKVSKDVASPSTTYGKAHHRGKGLETRLDAEGSRLSSDKDTGDFDLTDQYMYSDIV
jgi:hypothetical protein